MRRAELIFLCLVSGIWMTSAPSIANVGESSIEVSGEIVRTTCAIEAGNIELPDVKIGVFNNTGRPGGDVYYTYPAVFNIPLLTQCSQGETVKFSLPALAVNNEGGANLQVAGPGSACPSFQERTTCLPGADEVTTLVADPAGAINVPTKLTLNGANGASPGTLKFSIPVIINYE